MPGMDRTGPTGMGPMGSGMGPCGNGHQPGRGRGQGHGFRRGGGAGWRANLAGSVEEEKSLLEQRKIWLKAQLEAVEQLLENIDKPKA